MDVGALPGVEAESVDIIYACHVLDHFSRWTYMDVLRRWFTVLKPCGVLRLSCVNFAEVVDIYNRTRDVAALIGLLHARQDYPTNVRKMSWDYSSMAKDLTAVGFGTIRPWHPQFVDHGHIWDYSQATQPRTGGTIISLNIEGAK